MDIKEGDTSLNVLREIVSRHLEIDSLTLVLHSVAINWRQKFDTDIQKLSHINESLIQKIPVQRKNVSRQDFLQIDSDTLFMCAKNQVWSLTSKVKTSDGRFMHLPMMNFHPHNGVSVDDIVNFINFAITKNNGAILHSGRYYHYYGDYLLTEKQWIDFNAKFLMPCIFVSPRYIGHVLQDGYSSLRLTADDKYKPTVPNVIRFF
jgi:hypothetical protein